MRLFRLKWQSVTSFSCRYTKSSHHHVHCGTIMPSGLLDNEPLKKKSKLSIHNNNKFYCTNLKMPVSTANFKDNESEVINGLNESHDNESNSREDIKYLDTPTKSVSDNKEYRVIQLKNGLKALLIADNDASSSPTANINGEDTENNIPPTSASPLSSSSSSSEDDTDEDESEESREGTEKSDEESDNESDSSDESNGGMRISSDDEDGKKKKPHKTSSKREEKMAACGLCIGVGSFSDPPEIPGLAHFLEHMVFMGSKKYPQENEFDSFIQKCGGFDNASTEPEQTTFYFEIDEKHLFQALDRFTQFFIAPLMLRDAIAREREAVESEFQMVQPSDYHRKEQLFSSFAQPMHPATKFTWGNLITLRDNITEDKLYEKLHEFRARHYSAHRMTLAIQARLPLDTLEEYVYNCFSSIPSNDLPPEDFSRYIGAKSFDTNHFRRMYKIKPIKDSCQMELTWALPPLHDLYKVKPHQHVSWIIGHEGKGSLISYLRKKMWCLDIYSGNGEGGFEHSSMYALFSIALILTDDGHEHLKEILDAVFSYINMVKKFGPQERIFEEIRAIDDINFRFMEEIPPIDYVQELCEGMHLYTPTDYITGSDLSSKYDPESIKMCMDILTPENMNIVICNKQFSEEAFDKTEPWFNTKYTDVEIPEKWIESWLNIEPFPEFHLPEKNIYLPDDFQLISIDKHLEFPAKIHQDNLYELWYKPDAKFRLPECYMNFHLVSPAIIASADNAAMADLMVMILKHLLNEELYPAIAAEYNYDFHASKRGIVIELSGYHQKLPLLFETIIKYLGKYSVLITEDLFRVMKAEMLKICYNKVIKPGKLEKLVRLSILMLSSRSAIDKYHAIKNVTFEEFQHFVKAFPKHLYIQGLIQGNMTQANAVESVMKTFKNFECGSLLPHTTPQARVMALPVGKRCCVVKNFNPMDSNSLVTNYYQSDLRSIPLSVIIELFIMIVEEPLFNELRTRQQLGYDVSCLLRDTYGVLGYSITVGTQADKFTTREIDNRIEQFLVSFESKVNKMSDDEFETVKKSLIKLKQCADIHLKEEVMKNWAEITSGEFLFDRLTREVDEINKVNIQQIRDWFKTNILDSNTCKKLSIHVIGITEKEKNDEQQRIDRDRDNEVNKRASIVENGEENRLVIEYLSELPDDTKNKDDNSDDKKLSYNEYIMDIEKFKNKLYTYPVNGTDSS